MRKFQLYLKDILQAIENIESFVSGMKFEKFEEDVKTSSAVIRQFEILGEASKQIPSEIRDKYPKVPWSDMARMRDRLIHGYFNVEHRIVWDTIHDDLPPLKKQMQRVLDLEG